MIEHKLVSTWYTLQLQWEAQLPTRMTEERVEYLLFRRPNGYIRMKKVCRVLVDSLCKAQG